MRGSLKIPHLICWIGMKFQTTNCDLEVSLTQNGFMKPKKGWLLKRDLHQPGSFTPCPNSQLHDHNADFCFSQESALCRMLDHGNSTTHYTLLICSTKTEITTPNVQTKSPLALHNCCKPVLFLRFLTSCKMQQHRETCLYW